MNKKYIQKILNLVHVGYVNQNVDKVIKLKISYVNTFSLLKYIKT